MDFSHRFFIAACCLLLTTSPRVFAQDEATKAIKAAAETGAETAVAQAKEAVAGAAASATEAAPENPAPDAVMIPAGILDGGTEWLNTSKPIDLKDLRGKVVLLDFWTYCCINCIHVLPDLKFLEQKYGNQLVVIGVHSAKFDNEKLSDNIRDAILRYEIKHPVVNDSEMLIWKKFGTRSWPTLALIDPEGKFVGRQGGEGNRELFDNVIGKLVEYHRWKGTLDEKPVVFDLEENRSQPTPLRFPGKVLADAGSNRLFISDSNHNRIVITDLTGKLLDVIGSGQIGRSDGDYAAAEFDHPQGMELIEDTLYVADTENHLLRTVDLNTKTVHTLAGTGQQGRPRIVHGNLDKTLLNSPWDLCHINGVLYIAMAGPHQIWAHKIGSNKIQVHAGNAREDIINGSLADSSFAQPSGLTSNADGTFFYVADSEGSSIRQVPAADTGKVTTIAGTSELAQGQSLFAFGDVDAVGADARLQHPLGVAWHDDSVYVADSYNHKIRKIDLKTQAVTTWLGNGQAGDSLSPVQFSEPAGLSITDGKLYIADTNNHRIVVADLDTKAVSVVSLEGVTPPSPKKVRRTPPMKSAISLPEQQVAAGEVIEVTVDLAVPAGHKLNAIAPVIWEAFLLEGDQVLAPETLDGRREATVDGTTASFKVPVSAEGGTATVAIAMSYGYCGTKDAGICRLATATWAFKLTVNGDATATAVELSFPQAAVPAAKPVIDSKAEAND